MTVARLREIQCFSIDAVAAAASERLLRIGRVAATPMNHWGVAHADRLVRLVFSNEPRERLRGLGERLRRALL